MEDKMQLPYQNKADRNDVLTEFLFCQRGLKEASCAGGDVVACHNIHIVYINDAIIHQNYTEHIVDINNKNQRLDVLLSDGQQVQSSA